MRKYDKLKTSLLELVDALQRLEPNGTFVDEAEFTKNETGGIRVVYKARPAQLTILDGSRKFTLKIEEC